jgi:broad specificity phosphatase PhoE
MTKGTPISRRSVGALAGVPFVLNAAAADVWSALRTAGHFAMIRHASAPGTLDPPGFRLDDCATQRNLSAAGRAQAAHMGDLLRTNGITAARLYSSQWCRCLDTAMLMKLGDVTHQPLLNYFGPEPQPRARQLDALRAWIGRLDLGQPTLLVTHQVVISGIAESAAENGEILLLRRDADGRLSVETRQSTAIR